MLARKMIPFSALLGFLACTTAAAQLKSSLTILEVDVQLRFADGSPGPEGVHVELDSAESGFETDCITKQGGTCRLQPTTSGVYVVRIAQSDYAEVSQRVELTGIPHAYVNLTLRPTRGAEPTQPTALGPPVLAPKAQKELTRGLQALAANKPTEAQKHIEAAAHLAPNHPDVNYLLGLLAAQQGDRTTAQKDWEKAISLYPRHALALTALGETYLVANNLPEAKITLEKAVDADSNSWRAHQLLAMVLVKQHAYPDAEQQAQRALEIGKTDAVGAHLVLAEAFVGEQQVPKAIQTLQEMLKQNPGPAQAATAQRFLDALNKRSNPAAAQSAPGSAAEQAANMASLPLPSVDPQTLPSITSLPKWFPANVDDSIPSADTAIACPLNRITQQAGQRVEEFIHTVDRFTATETLDHESLNKFGLADHTEKRKFNYLVSIQEVHPGVLDVQEFRDGSAALDAFPDRIASLGMPSLVLVFHPMYVGDYDLRCEGLSRQNGVAAWQVHFSQKAGHPSRLRSYRLANRYYRVGLKGRAWISADTFQIIRMETDLEKQIPDIRLLAEHQTVDYGPVPFAKKNVTLWLPFDTDLYLDYNGHRIHRRHSFSNYLLFSVDEQQKIKAPPQPAEGDADSGSS